MYMQKNITLVENVYTGLGVLGNELNDSSGGRLWRTINTARIHVVKWKNCKCTWEESANGIATSDVNLLVSVREIDHTMGYFR